MSDNNGKETKEEVEQRPCLPYDLISQHILLLLPIKPLTQCKLLSKHYNATISCPNYVLNYFKTSVLCHPFTPVESLFIKSGNSYYIYNCTNHDNEDDAQVVGNIVNNLVSLDVVFDDEEIDLIGSDNGLVCLANIYGKYFYLYNPAINQYCIYYPGDYWYLYYCPMRIHTLWGFGYVESLDDFKVVRIVPIRSGEIISVVHVYSLRSNMWKKLDFSIEGYDLIFGGARLANEILYWSMLRAYTLTLDLDVINKTLAFNLALETFEVFPHLTICIPMRNNMLCVMGGCLCKCTSNSQNDLIFEILKRPGKTVSVRFSCDFNLGDCSQLIGFTKTGKVFALYSDPPMLGLLDQCSKRPLVAFRDHLRTQMDSYVPSQVSPFPLAAEPNEPGEGTWPAYQWPQWLSFMLLTEFLLVQQG